MPSGGWYLRGDNDVTAPQRDLQDVRRLPQIGLIQPAFQQRLDHGRAFLLLAEDPDGDLLPVAVGHLLGEGVQGEPHLGGGTERDAGRHRIACGGVGEAVPQVPGRDPVGRHHSGQRHAGLRAPSPVLA